MERKRPKGSDPLGLAFPSYGTEGFSMRLFLCGERLDDLVHFVLGLAKTFL